MQNFGPCERSRKTISCSLGKGFLIRKCACCNSNHSCLVARFSSSGLTAAANHVDRRIVLDVDLVLRRIDQKQLLRLDPPAFNVLAAQKWFQRRRFGVARDQPIAGCGVDNEGVIESRLDPVQGRSIDLPERLPALTILSRNLANGSSSSRHEPEPSRARDIVRAFGEIGLKVLRQGIPSEVHRTSPAWRRLC